MYIRKKLVTLQTPEGYDSLNNGPNTSNMTTKYSLLDKEHKFSFNRENNFSNFKNENMDIEKDETYSKTMP